MKTREAVILLETMCAVPARTMTREMFRLVRAAARRAQRAYPGMSGYYDPEFVGPRAQPGEYIFRPAFMADVVPQSKRLQEKVENIFPKERYSIEYFATLGCQ